MIFLYMLGMLMMATIASRIVKSVDNTVSRIVEKVDGIERSARERCGVYFRVGFAYLLCLACLLWPLTLSIFLGTSLLVSKE
jgi:hypothetical protein